MGGINRAKALTLVLEVFCLLAFILVWTHTNWNF